MPEHARCDKSASAYSKHFWHFLQVKDTARKDVNDLTISSNLCTMRNPRLIISDD